MQIVWIALFGLIGVFARYNIDALFSRLPEPFPYGTFVINLTGAFFAGLLYVIGAEKGAIPLPLRNGIMVGFLGGYTTFSSYCLQSAKLIELGHPWTAAAYLVGSPALGLLGAFAGLLTGRCITN